MNSSIYGNVNSGSSRIVEYIKNTISKYLIFIVLLFNIALNVVSSFYKIGFRNPFTVEFFLELFISISTTMICYMCFIPFGKQEEIKANSSYGKNLTLWGSLTNIVRNGFNDLFRLFCREQMESEREDAIRLVIENNTIIGFDEFCEKYRGKSKDEIKALVGNELTRKEARAINRANGNCIIFNPMHVKPINPVIILSGGNKKHINDAGRSDKSYTITWLFSRPFVMFVTNAVINAISTTFIGGSSNAVFDIFLSVFLIVMASVCGYNAGVQAIRYENDKIKSRILFLSLFTDKHSIKVPKIEEKTAKTN